MKRVTFGVSPAYTVSLLVEYTLILSGIWKPYSRWTVKGKVDVAG